jgi:gamma-glutamylcyclotransferase (GGCT)/AIG2-like uncharacterized protein YtfP
LGISPPRRSGRSRPAAGLFSYGTLQQREVQLATYGRELEGKPDALTGFRLASLIISDPHVVTVSGKAVHQIARETGNPADRIAGLLFELSDAELTDTDTYEVDAYKRIEVTLESGLKAWVYVGAPVGR